MELEAKEKLIREVNKYSTDEDVIGLYMELPREELERNTLIEEAKLTGFKMGENRGIKVGEKRGEKRGKLETALAMLKEGLDIELVQKVTGLTKKQIQKYNV